MLLREDETFLTGEGANRRGLTEPHRVAREFKRRLGDTTPILLGGVPYSAEALMARLLRSVVDEVAQREGGTPAAICVSHPANWGPYKTDLLLQAVRLAGLEEPVSFTTEPEAAAVFYAQQQRIEPGAIVAVYDLGGGTFDAAVLRKTAVGFEILGRPEGIERLGGIDFDAAVFSHVARALGGKLAELDEDDPAVDRRGGPAARGVRRGQGGALVRHRRVDPGAAAQRLHRGPADPRRAGGDGPAGAARLDRGAQAGAALGQGDRRTSCTRCCWSAARRGCRSSRSWSGAELGRPVAVDAHPKHAVALGAAWLASGALSAAARRRRAVRGRPPGGRAAAAVAAAPRRARPAPVTAGHGSVSARRGRVPVGPAPRPRRRRGPAPWSGRAQLPAAGGSVYGGRAAAAAPAPPGPAPVGLAARRRGLILIAAVIGLVVLVGGPAGSRWRCWTATRPGQAAGNQSTLTPTPAATTGPPTVPADEQCTDAIKANPRWVCLTKATSAGTSCGSSTSSPTTAPRSTTAAASTCTSTAPTRTARIRPTASWAPSPVLAAGELVHRGQATIGARVGQLPVRRDRGHPKVCARIAQSRHRLVAGRQRRIKPATASRSSPV